MPRMHFPPQAGFSMGAGGFQRKKPPLLEPRTITQLLKAIRKGHLPAPASNRLAAARHRRGKRGHESSQYADNPNPPKWIEEWGSVPSSVWDKLA